MTITTETTEIKTTGTKPPEPPNQPKQNYRKYEKMGDGIGYTYDGKKNLGMSFYRSGCLRYFFTPLSCISMLLVVQWFRLPVLVVLVILLLWWFHSSSVVSVFKVLVHAFSCNGLQLLCKG